MIAVDTNVLVRIIINDDARQAALAPDLLNQREVFISKTVLLETEWVLRSAYKFGPSAVREALRRFLDRSNVEIEDEATVRQRLGLESAGHGFRGRHAPRLGR
ncbi:MAG TPA: type II toxin-antitoxin system VapC family toxin [Candidatus Binataceae bacterium]|jgi:predicted nucleic-acid-binding protein|nr:type II toxin-antitoxin system VapC family toxin [Candidatus Binataceae bacterium]